MTKLKDGQREFSRRALYGRRCMEIAWNGGTDWDEIHADDRTSAAKDAISDILTALFGPAGAMTEKDDRISIEYDKEACAKAEALLASALNSYEGDAEDYLR